MVWIMSRRLVSRHITHQKIGIDSQTAERVQAPRNILDGFGYSAPEALGPAHIAQRRTHLYS